MTLARKMDSSPRVSSPRWSKLILEMTLDVACVTAAGIDSVPVWMRVATKSGELQEGKNR